ncbi:hypothetical protein RB195_023189 [Necator americanus]|uniref:Uncharacterized protein n=1 Tax=Necator americanus TaxID=51031 RepID=A0ABR1EIT0_NECAM
MTEEGKGYPKAKRNVSWTLEQMIPLIPKFCHPHDLTTASLLNTMSFEHGAFVGYSRRFNLGMKIPELRWLRAVLATFANLLPRIQWVYIDIITHIIRTQSVAVNQTDNLWGSQRHVGIVVGGLPAMRLMSHGIGYGSGPTIVVETQHMSGSAYFAFLGIGGSVSDLRSVT